LLPLLLDTLVRAVHYQGRAFAIFDVVKDQRSDDNEDRAKHKI